MNRVGWRVHVVASLILMIGVSTFVGFEGYFFIDEAAMYGQLEVRNDGEWTAPRPLADFDENAVHNPMVGSNIAGDRYAPFGKHPLHVEILRRADQIGGRTAVRLVSTLGAWIAAVAASVLARPAGRRASVIALWLTLVASPLVFHAQLVVGHALAAGLAGLAFVAVERVRGTRRVLLVAALLFSACLLRSEAVLLAGSLGVVLTFRGLQRRTINDIVTGGCAAFAGLAAYFVEPWLVAYVIGSDSTPQVISAASRGGIEGRLSGFRLAVLGTASGGEAQRAAILVVLVGVLGTATAVLVRRRPRDAGPALLIGAFTLAAALAFVLSPALVPGLLWSFPFLLASLVLVAMGVRTTEHPSAIWDWALPTAGLFGVGVLALQYEIAGGQEWGWRYFAIALPLIGLAVSVVVDSMWALARPLQARTALLLIGIAFLLVPFAGLRHQRSQLSETTAFLRASEEAIPPSSVDWIVSLDSSFGRFAYRRSLGGDLLTANLENVTPLLDELRTRGAEDIAFVWRHGQRPPTYDPGAFSVLEETVGLVGGYRAEIRSTP